MRRYLRPLQLLISVGILIWVYRRIPLDGVWSALRDADGWLVAATAGLALFLQVVVAARLGVLTEAAGLRLSLRKLVSIQLAAVFYKLFLPGGILASVGVRYYKLQQVSDGSSALSSAVVDRILATLGLGVIGAMCWLLDDPPLPASVGWVIAGWGASMLLLFLLLLGHTSGRVVQRLADATRIGSVSRRTARWIESLGGYRRMPRAARVRLLILSIVPHLVGLSLYAVAASSLDVHLGLLTWGWVRAAVTLLTTQPVSIAGLGVREVSLVYLLGFYGVTSETCVALASLLLGVGILFTALLGGLVESRSLWRRSAAAQR